MAATIATPAVSVRNTRGPKAMRVAPFFSAVSNSSSDQPPSGPIRIEMASVVLAASA